MKKVQAADFENDGSFLIDIADFPNGLYFITNAKKTGQYAVPFIKN